MNFTVSFKLLCGRFDLKFTFNTPVIVKLYHFCSCFLLASWAMVPLYHSTSYWWPGNDNCTGDHAVTPHLDAWIWASWMKNCSCSHGFNSLLLWDKSLYEYTWIRCPFIHNKIHSSIEMCDPGWTVVLNLQQDFAVLMLCQRWLAHLLTYLVKNAWKMLHFKLRIRPSLKL